MSAEGLSKIYYDPKTLDPWAVLSGYCGEPESFMSQV